MGDTQQMRYARRLMERCAPEWVSRIAYASMRRRCPESELALIVRVEHGRSVQLEFEFPVSMIWDWEASEYVDLDKTRIAFYEFQNGWKKKDYEETDISDL